MEKNIKKILETLENEGYQAYLVGGYVRDYLLGVTSFDVDIATDALPKDIHRIFNSSKNNYGSVNIKVDKLNVDITTFRKDLNYVNRRPSKVVYINNLKEDLERRDFTINAICMNKNGKIIDLLNGCKDLDRRTIKMIGSIDVKLKEDPLRIMRAIRFACILDFKIEDELYEKIKEYKNSIDVLTMTATPIPRTLHMSIVGVRDMSIIYEPPQNRKPVQTYVLEYDEEVVKEAITKELERDGQVFYLYNNVEGIERKANEILKLVPEAKVSYAHGKMSGNELENIMLDFINGETNVLVCTTILESGIDIPNANTIIVENADRLGLAQLYQIRGRVGRSDAQAYAYITYKRDKLLSEVADKRLKAMKEFTEFGSGFKIAMRDLEIRGAGSMLGEIQHGHMEQVGYDTYCNLLDQVIKEMKDIPQEEEEKDVQIDLNVSSYIPDSYITDSSQKIKIYQDIALCRTEEDIQNIIDEMIDIYGEIPAEVENLLNIARIKSLAKKLHIFRIQQKANGVVFSFEGESFKFDIVDKLLKEYRNKIKFSPGKDPYITYKIEELSDDKILFSIKEFLKFLCEN